jgi:WD40 repeat protein
MTVCLWDTQEGTLLATLKGHSGLVLSVAFSPDGQKLASGSDDETVRLWDSQAGTCLATLRGHSGGVKNVAFSPDGQRLASASYDETVCLWDSQAGTLLATLEAESYGMLFADSSTLYAGIPKLAPSVTGLVKVKFTGQSMSPTVVPIFWFPSSWNVSVVSIDPTCSYAAIGCKNGRVYIVDISEVVKNLNVS